MGSHWVNVDTGSVEGISPVLMPTYLVIKSFVSYVVVCEDELHMLECAIYDELHGEYGIASVQLTSIHDDVVKCVMNNYENVPSFWQKFSIFY